MILGVKGIKLNGTLFWLKHIILKISSRKLEHFDCEFSKAHHNHSLVTNAVISKNQ